MALAIFLTHPKRDWQPRWQRLVPFWLAAILCLITGPAGAEPTRRLAIRIQADAEVREIDDVTLAADVYYPIEGKGYPLVVMIHGGAWSAGDKWNLALHAREMARAGFVAVAINYRLAPKYDMAAQVEDCRAALRWAAREGSRFNGDPGRVALWGYSAGAHLSALLACRPEKGDPPVRACVAGGAPCEFSFIPKYSKTMINLLGATRAERPEVYRQFSPVEFASAGTCPFFFFHGTADLLVPLASSQMLYQKLLEFGVPAAYHTIHGKGHLTTFTDAESRRRAISFLKQYTQEQP